MPNVKISQLPYVGSSSYTNNDLFVFVNYTLPSGTTSHTYVSDIKDYVTSGLTFDYLPISGGTVTGDTTFTNGLTATTISATTYLNLPTTTIPTSLTGVTYDDSNNITFQNSTGGTETITLNLFSGLTATTISATTYLNLPQDIYVTGGTYSGGTLFLTNNSGYTFDITGFTTGIIDTYVTGFSYSDNTFTISDSSGNTFSQTVNNFTGLTINGDLVVTGNTNVQNLTANTFSASTYLGLPADIFITGGTFDKNTETLTLERNSGSSITITGITDYFTTGFTYSSNTFSISDNSGSTFDVTINDVTGLTVNGDLNIIGTTYSNTISATTISGDTLYGDGTNLTGVITGATNLGIGQTIFDTILDKNIELNSISGDQLGKVTATTNSNTIEIGVNETAFDLWSLVVQGNKLLKGDVSYVSGLTFNISNLSYIINGQIYNYNSTTGVTLNSGSTQDRIDVIYADDNNNIGVLSGTPSNNPEKQVVYGNQVEITFITVPASSTTLNLSSVLIFDENTGPPNEWTFSKAGGQSNLISAGTFVVSGYSGNTSIRVNGLSATTPSYANNFKFSSSTNVDTTNYSSIQFAIRNLSANNAASIIRFKFLTNGVQNGNVIYMNANNTAGYVQYNASNTSSWQLISIPLSPFNLINTQVREFEIAFQASTTPQRYYFDFFRLISGPTTQPTVSSWYGIKGDSATTIVPTNPLSTLTISGGTNIGSRVTGSTVVLDLDNNIQLNGVTATTISATTYQNLPSSTFTGNTSATCISDIFVSNIHSCSPLNINPLDEGNVYFGSTSAVTIDLSNERVGIGTSSPTSKLEVKGIGTGSTTSFNVTNSGGTSVFSVNDNGRVEIGNTFNTKGLVVTENGDVSIGAGSYKTITLGSNSLNTVNTFYLGNEQGVEGYGYTYLSLPYSSYNSNPNRRNKLNHLRLTNNGLTAYDIPAIIFENRDLTAGVQISTTTYANSIFLENDYLTVSNGLIGVANAETGTTNSSSYKDLRLRSGISTGNVDGGFIAFDTAPSGPAGTSLNTQVERVRITAQGNVGIGTSSPTAKVDVKGIDATSSNFSLKVDDSTSSALLYVRNNGKVGIGTSIPDTTLHIKGAGNTVSTNNFKIEDNGTNELLTVKDNSQINLLSQPFIKFSPTSISTYDSLMIGGNVGNNYSANTSAGIGAVAVGLNLAPSVGSNTGMALFGSNILPSLTTSGSRQSIFGYNLLTNMTSGTQNMLLGWGSFNQVTSGTRIFGMTHSVTSKASLTDVLIFGSSIDVQEDNTVWFGGVRQYGKFRPFGSDVDAFGSFSSYRLIFPSVTGSTNISGNNIDFEGSKSTGDKDGGGFIWKVSPAGSSGSTQNSLVEAMRISGNTYVGIGTSLPTAKLHIKGSTGYNQLRLETNYTPSSSGDTNGNIGDITWDDSYFYVKTNTGWGRVSLDYAF